MDCIEQLKKIGIKEINAQTKIAAKRLEDIFEYRFDELDRTRAKGFINILQREYKIDMSEWLQKYDEYQAQEEISKMQENPQDHMEKNNINVTFVDTTIRDKKYLGLFVAVIVLLVLFIIYFIYNNVFNDKEEVVENTQVESIQSLSDMQPPITTIQESKEEFKEETQGETQEEISTNTNNAESLESTKESNTNLDSNIKDNTQDNIVDSNTTIQQNSTLFNQIAPNVTTDELIITPKSPLWVGIIDLQTHKKKQVSIANKWHMKLDDSVIIRTGHGYFDIDAPNNFDKQYIGGDNKYFLWTKESGFKEISKNDFLSFNRGEEW